MPMEGMDPMTRRRAKAINFGIIYGISALRPGPPARHRARRGARLHRRLFRALSRHPRLHGAHQGGGAHHTATSLTPFGRRCWIPGIADKNPAPPRLCRAAGDQRAAARRRRRHHQARHGPPARPRCARPACAARLLLQVHDELLFEAPEDEAEALAARRHAA